MSEHFKFSEALPNGRETCAASQAPPSGYSVDLPREVARCRADCPNARTLHAGTTEYVSIYLCSLLRLSQPVCLKSSRVNTCQLRRQVGGLYNPNQPVQEPQFYGPRLPSSSQLLTLLMAVSVLYAFFSTLARHEVLFGGCVRKLPDPVIRTLDLCLRPFEVLKLDSVCSNRHTLYTLVNCQITVCQDDCCSPLAARQAETSSSYDYRTCRKRHAAVADTEARHIKFERPGR